jgi:IS30 family transposase
MPFNPNNPYSLVSQAMCDPMPRADPCPMKHKNITAQECEVILRLHQAGLTQKDIATELGRDPDAVGRRLRQLGVWSSRAKCRAGNSRAHITDADAESERIVDLY